MLYHLKVMTSPVGGNLERCPENEYQDKRREYLVAQAYASAEDDVE